MRTCRCTPDQVARYQGKLSGPLLDRIDLHVEVPAVPAEELLHAPPGEGSDLVRQRVIAARARALARQGCTNQALQGREIDTQARPMPTRCASCRPPPPGSAGLAAARTAPSRSPAPSPTWPAATA